MATAEEILARRTEEREILLAAQREQVAASRAAELERRAAMPQARFEPPPVIEGGERYVMALEKIWAFDPVDDREYLACLPGEWLRAEHAEKLGLEGEPMVLSMRPA